MILDETYKFLKTECNAQIENLKIEEVRVGAHLAAVKLSDSSYGVSSTLVDAHCYRPKEKRDFGDFTPSRITGQYVTSLFEIDKNSNIINTLRITVLNAISSRLLSSGKYNVIENADPIELIDLNQKKTITIVGAFQSYINRLAATNNKLNVLELNKNALIGEQEKYYVPAEDYMEVIPESDVVIITGLTLVNGTIDGLLDVVAPDTKVIVTGHSSSLVPDILFKNKVNIIGATRIVDPNLLFSIVSEFGAGYHLMKYCAQKICIVNEKTN
jgi:uncharacterized protein (DUF4213/DUF364 family)